MRWTLLLLLLLCNYICFAQVVTEPAYERSSFEVVHPHVNKVEFKNDTTVVYCTINNQDSWSYSIPNTMYIEDVETKKRYQIIRCEGLPFKPKERQYNKGVDYQFIFYFPYIQNLRIFNLIEKPLEDSFFNIYGINLSECNLVKYDENDYRRLKNMSDFYLSANDDAKYLEYEEKELNAAQYIYGTKSLAASTCYHQLSEIYNRLGDNPKAIKFGLQSLECDSIYFGIENKENPIYANTLGEISRCYQNAGNDEESLRCTQKCLSIWRSIENAENYFREIASLLYSGRDILGIVKRIETVERELKNLPDFVDYNSIVIAEILKQMSLCYWMIDDNKSAINCCDKALAIYEIKNEKYADLLSSKCKYQRHSGFDRETILTGENAKQIYDSLNIKSTIYAELIGNLAWAYGICYNFERSIQLQNMSVEIYENVKDWLSLAEAYNSISHYYHCANNIENAEQYIKKAISVLKEHDDANQIINADVERLGDKSIVTPFALSQIKRRIDYDMINFYHTLSRIYQKEDKIQEAIETEKENGIIINEIGDNRAYNIHLMTMAQYYLLDKQFNNAIECIEQACQIDNNQNSLANNKILLSYVLFEMGNYMNAIQYVKESISLFKSIGDTEGYINAQYVLSLFFWKIHDYEKAELYLSEILEIIKCKISKEVTGMTNEQKQRIWDIYDHYFLLYRNIIEKSDRNTSLLSKLYDYILFSKSLLLDTEMNEGHPGGQFGQIVSWKDIQKQLSDNDIAIEFITTLDENKNSNSYHALIVDKVCQSPQMITLYSESDLGKKRETDKRDIRMIVEELIWEPIIFKYNNVENIYFSPDGILYMLPIEYYNLEELDNLFEQCNLYRLSSTKELVKEHVDRRKTKAILYGGLDYNLSTEIEHEGKVELISSLSRYISERGGFDPLYNTLAETQGIRDLLVKNNISATLLSDKNGTEESFKMLSNQGINMIHLATHGMYISPNNIAAKRQENNYDFLKQIVNDKDPVKEDIALTHSFLVMAGGNRLIHREKVINGDDGILTALEISQMNLKELDLVVISACESARGDLNNEGVYGLQRGFKKAGANTILMSLDKVDDEATKILMVEFYRNLMNGKTKQQSLKEAQKYLRQFDNGKYDKPEYWASFIMLDGIN